MLKHAVSLCVVCFVVPGDWKHWSHRVEEYIYPSDSVPEFSTILVPNVDSVRTNFLIDTIAKQHKVSAVRNNGRGNGTVLKTLNSNPAEVAPK